MPRSTPEHVRVTTDTCADDLREQLLQPRRVYLKHRAPRSQYVHDVRRKIAAHHVRPIDMLMAVMLADVDDGIPASLVTQWLDSAKAIIEARAAERHRVAVAAPSLLPLYRRETRAQAALDEAQGWALAEPENPAALAAVEERAAEYDAAEQSYVSAIRQQRARLTMQRA